MNNFRNIKVSIIIPTYNSSKTIKKTIKSVLFQTYTNWEIIIIDSYSRDQTLNYIRNLNEKRIRIFYNPLHKGLASARNKGINVAKGSLILFLDSDDILLPKKIEWHVNFILSKRVLFSCTNYIIKSKDFSLNVDNKINFFDFKYLIFNRPIALSTVIVKKNLIKKISNNFKENQYAEDYLWWLMLLKKIAFCYNFKRNLSIIKVHRNNRSKNFFRNISSLVRIYRHYFHFSYLKIFFTFVLLFFRTFKKNFIRYKLLLKL